MEQPNGTRRGDAPESRYYEAPESSVESAADDARFYAVGPVKFVLMYVATFGLYAVYWSYRNWRFIKDRDQSEVIPWLCAIFYPLTFYWFMKSLSSSLDSRLLSSTAGRVLLAIALYGFSGAGALSDPYWLISLLGFTVLLPAVVAMVSTANEVPARAQRVPAFHWSNAFAYLFGIPLVLLVASSMTGVVPSTMVVTGEQMPESDIVYLRENGILGEDEQIEHFYSTALLSIADDGQFYSTEYVTSYMTDPETGELYLRYASYPEIQDIQVAWSQSFIDDTIVTVVTHEEGSFELWLSAENDGDREFVDGMMTLWREKRDPT